MPKIAVEIDLQQIEQMINQLRVNDRIMLIQRLEQKTWGERFHSLVARIDKHRRKYPISSKELLKLVKQARQERHASSRS